MKFLPIALLTISGSLTSVLSSPNLNAANSTVSLSPNQAESAKSFQVTVKGWSRHCMPQFFHHETTVSGSNIRFTVEARSNPAANCIDAEAEYTTDFQVPALKAGKYATTIALEPPCRNEIPVCLSPSYLEIGEDLTIVDSGSFEYGIRPNQVDTEKPFDLNLTHMNWSCNHEFTNRIAEINGHSIYLNYTQRLKPGIACAQIRQEYQIPFKISALMPGTYQVFSMPHEYCEPNSPCPMVKKAYIHSGALTVGANITTSTSPKASFELRNNNSKASVDIDTKRGVRTWWKGLSTNLMGRME